MMEITLSDDRRDALRGHLKTLFTEEFDEDLSDFRADDIIDVMLKTLGPVAYNQAVEDVRKSLQVKLDDLSGEVRVDGLI
ncbi:MAG: DUF2164 domain-containing protein [Pseudomonadota bacterium]